MKHNHSDLAAPKTSGQNRVVLFSPRELVDIGVCIAPQADIQSQLRGERGEKVCVETRPAGEL